MNVLKPDSKLIDKLKEQNNYLKENNNYLTDKIIELQDNLSFEKYKNSSYKSAIKELKTILLLSVLLLIFLTVINLIK